MDSSKTMISSEKLSFLNKLLDSELEALRQPLEDKFSTVAYSNQFSQQQQNQGQQQIIESPIKKKSKRNESVKTKKTPSVKNRQSSSKKSLKQSFSNKEKIEKQKNKIPSNLLLEEEDVMKLRQKNIELNAEIEKLNKKLHRLELQTQKNQTLESDYNRLLNQFEKSEFIRKQQKSLIDHLKLELEAFQKQKSQSKSKNKSKNKK